MKKSKIDKEQRAGLSSSLEISAESFPECPETCTEMVNAYGTYNIQPTSNTDNDFPAIAQGTTPYIKERTLEFFRDGDDPNPAGNISDEHSV